MKEKGYYFVEEIHYLTVVACNVEICCSYFVLMTWPVLLFTKTGSLYSLLVNSYHLSALLCIWS